MLTATLLLAGVLATPKAPIFGNAANPADIVHREPKRRAQTLRAEPIVTLAKLPASQIAALRNDDDPLKRVGYVRELKTPHRIARNAAVGVRVIGADRVRLKLTSVQAEDATFWVYGKHDRAVQFDASLLDIDGALWTPSVSGDVAYLEIAAPQSADVGVSIAAVAEIHLPVPLDDSCIADVSCAAPAAVKSFSSAIAGYMVVRSDGTVATCSGGLLADRNETHTPYFLTARHCVASATEAASVEAFWDYRSASCGGGAPALESLLRSNGSVLLESSALMDMTFLRFAAVPGTRAWLGWDPHASAVNAGTLLHRISHPFGLPQRYSTGSIDAGATTCSATPRANYIYTSMVSGATASGSSGAPAFIDGGFVVGQLRGGCGPDPTNACDTRNLDMDGSFAQTYEILRPYLENLTQPCAPDATTLCLNHNRFAVSVAWKTSAGTGRGRAVPMTNDTGHFWFFSNANVELVIKILDGRVINERFLVFFGALSDVEYTITVRDTHTSASRTYHNPPGRMASVSDVNAFQ